MPEEILIIVVLGILSGTLLGVVSQVRQYLEAKNGIGANSSGTSMRTSELEEMMQRAAQKSVRPLIKRIENLEAAVADGELPDLLSDADSYFESEVTDSRIKVTRQNRQNDL